MELIDAFDVGKDTYHNFVGKHMMFTISKDHLEVEHLQGNKNDINYLT